MGRWQKVYSYPDIICDTGHNVDGIKYICEQLDFYQQTLKQQLHFVFGMVNDKDISSVLKLLPKNAIYYFTKASVKRALPENELLKQAEEAGLTGTAYPTVVDAVQAAKKNCLPKDLIFVGGSSISTNASFGRAFTATAERAGKAPSKYVAYTPFIPAKKDIS